MSLQLNDLLIGYDGGPLPAPVTARLQPGRLACLLGPNGAGKSTLMRTIAGLQKPLGGTLHIGSDKENDDSKIAIVTTERVMTQVLLARDVVELGRSPHTGFFGRLTQEDRDVVAWAAGLTGIEPLMSRSMATLSDGERQKVMIAKALAQQTPLILLDEPTAFLDFPSKVSTLLLLNRLCQEQGKSILVSTHDLDLALQTAQELWLLPKGRPLIQGTTQELAASGALAACFQTPYLQFNEREMRFVVKRDSSTL